MDLDSFFSHKPLKISCIVTKSLEKESVAILQQGDINDKPK